MKKQRDHLITNLMWKEVALKGPSASMAFIIFAVIIFFYKFGLVIHATLLQVFCVLVMIANITRIIIYKKVSLESYSEVKYRKLLASTIWLNAFGWGIVFAITTYETNAQGVYFPLMATLMAGYLTGSIITLSYDKSLYFPFQILVLTPMGIVSFYLYVTERNSNGLAFVIFFCTYSLYQIRQYLNYKKQLIGRFSNQLDLEDSYKELKKKQENFVAQTAKLMHASKISALGEMAAGLAHEVNNSLMVIMGATQQIERKLQAANEMDDKIQAKFDQSTTSILKIKTVIEGLKQFSLQLEPSPKSKTELKEVIERTMPYCQELLSANNIHFEVSEVPGLSINCQPFQIIQILFSLTKNSYDAIVDLKPEEKWIKYSFETHGDYVYIKVLNGGETISQENINRLFQPFFTTKDVGQGTGLSLSISKGYALDHKGDLFFDSRGPHTTFVLKLPIFN